MATADPAENALFGWAEDLPRPLWDDLRGRDPIAAATACGARWDGARFVLPLLGRDYCVEPAAMRLTSVEAPERRVDYQTAMILVKTLAFSTGASPSGQMATPRELVGGELFFNGPHAVNTPALERRFGADGQGLIARALAMGGQVSDGADVAVRLPGLPMLPLWALLWLADDEFPARAVVGVDSRAAQHLPLDGVWALTNLLIHRLTTGGGNG